MWWGGGSGDGGDGGDDDDDDDDDDIAGLEFQSDFNVKSIFENTCQKRRLVLSQALACVISYLAPFLLNIREITPKWAEFHS